MQTYQRIVRRGDIVLDIGANIGAHTLHLAQAVGAAGKVWAIEPTDYAMAKLKANIALNPGLAARIVCCQLMLVDRTEGYEVPPSIRAGRSPARRICTRATVAASCRPRTPARRDAQFLCP